MKNRHLHLSCLIAFICCFTSCKNEVVNKDSIEISQDHTVEKKIPIVKKSEEKDSSVVKIVQPKESKKPTTPVKPKKIAKKKLWPKIEFEQMEYDFGEIVEGDTVDYKFKFVNTGKATLEITNAKATCGCTQPSYPFIGIEKGEEGTIGVRYVSIGKKGPQDAKITISSNAANPKVELHLKGNVLPKKEEKLEKDSLF